MLTDGWEYATAYDWLLTHADAMEFAIVMPTVRDAAGDMGAFWCALVPELVPHLLHPTERVRLTGICLLARSAVESAHNFIEED